MLQSVTSVIIGNSRKLLSWPVAFAIIFIAIPPFLFYSYPSSFWADSDYEPLGLASALNLAYRIGDFRFYPAPCLGDHPGVPFYFMSWLALALTGFPVASKGPGFFSAVIAHVKEFYQISVWLAALVGGAGVCIFARTARNLVPAGVVAIGLLAWLMSTPATLLMFTTPSIESFAMLINALFLYALVRIAYDPGFSRRVTVLAACVSAFAYLNKLSYINVSLALSAAGIFGLVFGGAGLVLTRQRCVLFALTSLGVILAVGCLIIGWSDFLHVLRFHKSIAFNSGLYGTGSQYIVSTDEVWRAVAAIPSDKDFAVPIALVVGGVLAVAGLFTARRGPQHMPVAIICVGAGLASVFAAVFVLKHYSIYYTPGVSPTLPAAAVASYLLMKSLGKGLRIASAILATLAILFMTYETVPRLIFILDARTQKSEMAAADLPQIYAKSADDQRPVVFLYRAPFSWFGEGSVISNAGVPRLQDDYIQSRPKMFSAEITRSSNRPVGSYVIDKSYYPTVESIKASPNLNVLEPHPVMVESGDKIVELKTVFLLNRK